MKTENLSIGLRALYHAIEWLTVFLILLISLRCRSSRRSTR